MTFKTLLESEHNFHRYINELSEQEKKRVMIKCYQCREKIPVEKLSKKSNGEYIPVCQKCNKSIKQRINIINAI